METSLRTTIEEFLKNGDDVGALSKLEALLPEHPMNFWGYVTAGDISLKRGDIVQALIYYRKCVEIDPSAFRPKIGIANLLFSKGDFDKALEILTSLHFEFPDDSRCASLLATTLIRCNRTAEAVQTLTSYLLAHPAEDMLWVELGDANQKAGNDYQAIKSYQASIRANGKNFWAHRNLGILLFAIGSYEEAATHLITAAKDGSYKQYSAELRNTFVSALFYLRRGMAEVQAGICDLPINEFESVITNNTWYNAPSALCASVALVFSEQKLGQINRASLRDGETTLGFGILGYAPTDPRRYACVAQLSAVGITFNLAVHQKPTDLNILVQFDSGEIRLVQLQQSISDQSQKLAPQTGLDLWELGDFYFKHHENDAAALYYNLAVREGGAPDVESFAQCLLNLGRYHEAEMVLEKAINFNSGSLDSDQLGRVIDMYCNELARVALPGYLEKLTEVCSRNFQEKDIQHSRRTNVGHLKLVKDDMSAALAEYKAASVLAERRTLVHFSNGIHSAITELDTIAEPFSDIKWDVAQSFEHAKAVHLFACDRTYFARYAPSLIASSSQRSQGQVPVHVHVIDPDESSFALLNSLRERWQLNFSYEFHPKLRINPANVRTYFTCARFLVGPQIMKRYGLPLCITEADCLVNWSWQEIRDWIGPSADAGMHLSGIWSLVPWTKIPAGILYLNASPQGMMIAEFIAGYIQNVLRMKGSTGVNLWTIDQFAIWRAWQEFHNCADIIHLPMYSALTLAVGDKSNVVIADV